MALESKIVTVPFAQGLDTKDDPFQVPPGRLLELENAVFTQPGRLTKRNGFAALSRDTADGDPIGAGVALGAFRDELLLADGDSLWSYNEGAETWTDKGRCVSLRAQVTPVISDAYAQTFQDGAVHSSGLACYVWEQASQGDPSVRYSVLDSATGQIVVASTLAKLNAIKPKVVVFGGFFVLGWYDTAAGKLFIAPLPVASPTASLSPIAASGASSDYAINATAPNYDMVTMATESGERLFIALNSATTGHAVVTFTTAFITPTQLAFASGSSAKAEAIAIFADLYVGGPMVALFNGTAVRLYVYAADLTLEDNIEVATVTDVVLISGVSVSSAARELRVAISQSAAQTYNYTTTCYLIAGATPTVGSAMTIRSAALGGKLFSRNGTAWLPLVYESPLQPTYFLADETGYLAARILPGNAGPIPSRETLGTSLLPETGSATDGVWMWAVLAKDLVTSSSATGVYTSTGVSSAKLAFDSATDLYAQAELANNLHIGGGWLQMYDGAGVVEHGFALYPEPVALSGGTPGDLSTQYVVCYAWTDQWGQVHRSAPSVAAEVLLASPISPSNTVTVTIPTLRLTNKPSNRPVILEVYRTQANQQTLYLTYAAIGDPNSPTNPVLNDLTVDTVTFDDEATDAQIIGNPQLYTTGSVLEAISPPPTTILAVHRNRVFAASDEDQLVLWYSQQAVAGSPIWFNDSLTLNIDPKGGPVTALASLDDKLIVFKGDRIFAITGQGPDSTGGQFDFSDSILITTDAGCINQRSVTITPNGLVFQSAKGIYLLDRALAVGYIGAAVAQFNSETITGARLLATVNQVRFTLESGLLLNYDYLVNQWSTFTPIGGVDAIVWQRQFVYLKSDGRACVEAPGVFTDPDGQYISMKATTAWLSFDGLQGYQRVREMLILGQLYSAHRLNVAFSYDFVPVQAQQLTVVPRMGGAYGADSPYGAASPYGGNRVLPYQWRCLPGRQKAQSLQVTIWDQPTDADPGEGMSLSALTFEVGVKPGTNRTARNRNL